MRRRKAIHYSEPFVVVLALFAVALLLWGFLTALIIAILATLAMAGYVFYRLEMRRQAYKRWFDNNRGRKNIQEMAPLKLESFTGELFTRLGYQAIVTKASGDNGIDVIAKKDGKLYVIQVKQTGKAVGSPTIQTLCGSMLHAGADYGICLAPSGFTRQAREFASDKNVTLLDMNDIEALLEKL